MISSARMERAEVAVEVAINLPEEAYRQLVRIAEDLGKTPNELMVEIIENYLNELERDFQLPRGA